MNGLLKRLNGQTKIDFIGGNIFTDIRQICCLHTVQKLKKRQNFIICGYALLLSTDCSSERLYLKLISLRYPKVIRWPDGTSRLPGIFHIIKIILGLLVLPPIMRRFNTSTSPSGG